MKAAPPTAVRLSVAIAARLAFAALALFATVVFSYFLLHPRLPADGPSQPPHSTLAPPSGDHTPPAGNATALLR
ncbi:hypothetical protein [Nocardia callitridis]|uniref:Uncharacterized protein n=1 Tax=Nocardia callitridis TaxID=648753 RepID=A0ABP9KXZ7_9NOCA